MSNLGQLTSWDYHSLPTSIIRPQPVQLPKIQELLDEIACQKCNIMSSVDMKAGFWQIPLNPKSRKYTSFSNSKGEKFQWAVCPFGLSTSPSAMIYVLSTVFAGKLGKHMWLYMDDLSIGSSNCTDHMASLKTCFKHWLKTIFQLTFLSVSGDIRTFHF